jgi:hypothetical protein
MVFMLVISVIASVPIGSPIAMLSTLIFLPIILLTTFVMWFRDFYTGDIDNPLYQYSK